MARTTDLARVYTAAKQHICKFHGQCRMSLRAAPEQLLSCNLFQKHGFPATCARGSFRASSLGC
eukprot:4317639-Alexandrium_andersonii.AAC.1